MRHVSIGLAGAALLVLAACGGSASDEAANAAEETAADAADASTDEAAAKPAAEDAASGDDQSADAAGGGGATLSREYLVGRWSEDDDCSDVIEFRADGTFLFPWGDTGNWQLNGDRLTMSTNTDDLQLAAIDRDHMQVTYRRGRVATNRRC